MLGRINRRSARNRARVSNSVSRRTTATTPVRTPRTPTGTPRDRTMGPRPVTKRPTQTTGTIQAKRKLPTGMDIPKWRTASSTAKTMTSAADAARLGKLKEVMNKRNASDRAGKARSTGTPRARVRPTTATPTRRTPTAVGTPRRPSIPARPGNAGPMKRRVR